MSRVLIFAGDAATVLTLDYVLATVFAWVGPPLTSAASN